MSGTRRGSYPHPVLDASDDVEADIEVFNASFAPSVDDVEVKFQLRMNQPHIQALLDAGSARYSVRWTCSSTIANGDLDVRALIKHADSTTYVGWIDQQLIRRTVKVEIKIVATTTIEQYYLRGQHPDYGDASFRLLPGDILADGGVLEFEADKLYDPLRPPIGSCFRFVPDTTVKRGLRVRFHDDDHVIVSFPEELLQGFSMLRNRQDLQISLVVLPALMETIAYIRENDAAGDDGEDLSNRRWHAAVTRLMGNSRSAAQRPFELAQEILGNPLAASLTTTFDDLGD